MTTITRTFNDAEWQIVPKVATPEMLHHFDIEFRRRLWIHALAAAPQPPDAWQPIETAPKDGTLLLLLVQDGDNTTEDEVVWRTIGSNTSDNTAEEEPWQMAGWNWSYDHYCAGNGKVIGWMPLPAPQKEAK